MSAAYVSLAQNRYTFGSWRLRPDAAAGTSAKRHAVAAPHPLPRLNKIEPGRRCVVVCRLDGDAEDSYWEVRVLEPPDAANRVLVCYQHQSEDERVPVERLRVSPDEGALERIWPHSAMRNARWNDAPAFVPALAPKVEPEAKPAAEPIEPEAEPAVEPAAEPAVILPFFPPFPHIPFIDPAQLVEEAAERPAKRARISTNALKTEMKRAALENERARSEMPRVLATMEKCASITSGAYFDTAALAFGGGEADDDSEFGQEMKRDAQCRISAFRIHAPPPKYRAASFLDDRPALKWHFE